jgi:outer membrane protein assembly factor BamB
MSENWFWAEPVVYNNTVYTGSLDGKIYALQANSGDQVAEFNLESPVSSTPVIVDSAIIFASREGVIYNLDTDSNELRRLADIGEEVYGPLSASDGIVYVHTQDLTLHRINANTGAVLMSISLKSKE